MNEKILNINGVDLYTESFGNPTDPTLLSIVGATASMLWHQDFCCKLAEAGRYLIFLD